RHRADRDEQVKSERGAHAPRSPSSLRLRRADLRGRPFLSLGRQRLQERPAVLVQIIADGAGPQDAQAEAPRPAGAAARDRQQQLLAEEAARADQADAGGGQVAAQEAEIAAVLGLHLDRLDEVEAVLLAALDAADGVAVLLDQLADGAQDQLLLVLLLADA